MARDTGWFKSTYSDSGNDTCVEVRIIDTVVVGLRDSKGPTTGAIWLPPTAWTAFRSMVINSR